MMWITSEEINIEPGEISIDEQVRNLLDDIYFKFENLQDTQNEKGFKEKMSNTISKLDKAFFLKKEPRIISICIKVIRTLINAESNGNKIMTPAKTEVIFSIVNLIDIIAGKFVAPKKNISCKTETIIKKITVNNRNKYNKELNKTMEKYWNNRKKAKKDAKKFGVGVAVFCLPWTEPGFKGVLISDWYICKQNVTKIKSEKKITVILPFKVEYKTKKGKIKKTDTLHFNITHKVDMSKKKKRWHKKTITPHVLKRIVDGLDKNSEIEENLTDKREKKLWKIIITSGDGFTEGFKFKIKKVIKGIK